ncbi:COG1470 family protein [Streptomyces aureus]|uniref:COG1470 family protein n=1 Tax=Streptomyces aureus TaxID=193461 RepID=UPI0036435820
MKIPARTRAEVPFTVTVPADATPGDHPGAVVASANGRDSGVSVHLRVSGPTLSALTVERVRVAGGRISYDLVNRGNTVLTPRLAVRADGVLGRALDRRPRTLPVELLPGRRVTLSEPWKNAPALDSVRVRLTVTAGGGAHDEATATKRFVPWAAVAGTCAVILAAGGAAFWFVRRRRHSTGGHAGNGKNGKNSESSENGANSGNHGSQEIQGSWS